MITYTHPRVLPTTLCSSIDRKEDIISTRIAFFHCPADVMLESPTKSKLPLVIHNLHSIRSPQRIGFHVLNHTAHQDTKKAQSSQSSSGAHFTDRIGFGTCACACACACGGTLAARGRRGACGRSRGLRGSGGSGGAGRLRAHRRLASRALVTDNTTCNLGLGAG